MFQQVNEKFHFSIIFVRNQLASYLGEPVAFVEVGRPVAVADRHHQGRSFVVMVTAGNEVEGALVQAGANFH